jgi:hypothetical protein
MAKRQTYDWEAIKKEYIADQLSNCEISRKYGAPESSIRYQAKKFKWKKSLGKTVREKINDKLLRDGLRDPDVSDEVAIEAASDRGAGVVRLQRKDIMVLRELETKLLAELSDNPTKLYITQYQGAIVSAEVGIAVTDRAAALNNLANVQHKRIQLERQAYSLDSDDKQTGLTTLADALREIDKQ